MVIRPYHVMCQLSFSCSLRSNQYFGSLAAARFSRVLSIDSIQSFTNEVNRVTESAKTFSRMRVMRSRLLGHSCPSAVPCGLTNKLSLAAARLSRFQLCGIHSFANDVSRSSSSAKILAKMRVVRSRLLVVVVVGCWKYRSHELVPPRFTDCLASVYCECISSIVTAKSPTPLSRMVCKFRGCLTIGRSWHIPSNAGLRPSRNRLRAPVMPNSTPRSS